MKKLGLLVMALAAVAVLGVAAYAAVTPASKAVPVKKVAVKLMTAKGTITVVDVKAGTFSLKEANVASEMTFMVSAKLAKALKAGEKVVVGYKTMASGENHAVYVNLEKVKKVAAPKK